MADTKKVERSVKIPGGGNGNPNWTGIHLDDQKKAEEPKVVEKPKAEPHKIDKSGLA